MFTKVLLLRVIGPILLVLLVLRFAKTPILVRFREKIRFDAWIKKIVVILFALALLGFGLDQLAQWLGPDREDLTIQRQGGRRSSLPPPIHGRPFGRQ